MSEYKELVKDLNDLQELPPMECVEEYHNAHDRKLYGRAASELERLAFTREAWMGAAEDYVRRAEAAEAEVERLKGVLGEVKRRSQIDPGPLPHESQVLVKLQSCFEIARSALEAKP